MTVLDAQAVVALLLGEPAARRVADLIRDESSPAVISALNVAELFDVLVRVHGRAPVDVGEKLDWLIAGGLAIVPMDEPLARSAGLIRAEHYDRLRRPLSLADCVALATAVERNDALATADRPLSEAAARRGVDIITLPNSEQ